MNPVETFFAADRTVTTTIAALPREAWTAVVEPVFATGAFGDGSVRGSVAHLARDEAWIPSQLAGETMAEAGETVFDGDLLGADPAASFAGLATRAQEAAAGVTDPGATVHCSFGDCPVEEYLWQLVVARTLAAEALSRAAGLASPVDDELADAVLVGLAPRAELWRTVGILLPAREPGSSSARDRLLALVGVITEGR